MFAALWVAALIGCLGQVAYSDDWVGPYEREVFSPSGNLKVRIVPGKSYGDQFGFLGAPKGPYATAELYSKSGMDSYKPTRSFTLLNPVAPVDVFLTDSGRVITLDNWHNMGYGKVVVLYDLSGSVIRAYSLQDLFAPTDIKQFRRSVSSIRWRQALSSFSPERIGGKVSNTWKGPKLSIRQRAICIATETTVGNLEFSLETGEFLREQPCVPLH